MTFIAPISCRTTGASVLANGLAHLCSDLIDGVGLGYIRYVVMQDAVVGDEVLRVAGGIDDLGVGWRDPGGVGQLPAVDAGESRIREPDGVCAARRSV